MEIETCAAHCVVREDYRTLVRADVRIEVPAGNDKIRIFYAAMARTAARWAEETGGEQAKAAYRALPDIWEKSRFQPWIMQVRGQCRRIDECHTAVVVECLFQNGVDRETRRTAQVWNLKEGSVLSEREILRRWTGSGRRPAIGYRADGCYPTDEGEMIFFRNPQKGEPFRETRGKFEKKRKIDKKQTKKG